MNKYSKINLSGNFKNKKILIRGNLNVPIADGKIESDFRLKAIMETLNFFIEKKAKIILMGHIGREKENSLGLVFEWLKKKIHQKIFFDEKTFLDIEKKNNSELLEKFSEINKKISDLENGEILLLDNLRGTELEKKNDEKISKKLADICDFYVNEDFSVSHRKHMSVDALPKNFSEGKILLGFNFQKELEILEKIKNFETDGGKIFILGGVKIETKVPVLKNLLKSFDKIILGGAIVNNFYKKLGYEVGESKYDENFIFEENFFEEIMNSGKIFLPNIVITQNGEKEISELKKKDKILDISPSSFFEIEEELKSAGFIFFNGPVGFYEGGYKDGTKYLLEIFDSKNNFFVAGGGNTASAIFELGLEKNIDFISTGGGSLIKRLSV